MMGVERLLNPFAKPMQDPIDRAAVEVVKNWLRGMMTARNVIDEHDIPLLALTPDTLTQMSIDIAAAMRAAAQGQIR